MNFIFRIILLIIEYIESIEKGKNYVINSNHLINNQLVFLLLELFELLVCFYEDILSFLYNSSLKSNDLASQD